jgi:hypothetical protein
MDGARGRPMPDGEDDNAHDAHVKCISRAVSRLRLHDVRDGDGNGEGDRDAVDPGNVALSLAALSLEALSLAAPSPPAQGGVTKPKTKKKKKKKKKQLAAARPIYPYKAMDRTIHVCGTCDGFGELSDEAVCPTCVGEGAVMMFWD